MRSASRVAGKVIARVKVDWRSTGSSEKSKREDIVGASGYLRLMD